MFSTSLFALRRPHGHAPLRRWALASCTVSLLLLATGSASSTPISDFVISEIMYEPTGGDNGRQWVEINNGTTSIVDLSDYQLEWGQNSLANSITLTGFLNPNTTFVIGGPTSDGNNSNPIYDQIFNFNPDLGDGGHPSREDALALVQISTSTVMHIVVYGGNGLAVPFTDEQGNPATVVDVSGLGQDDSLEYLGTNTWQVQTTATPGTPHANLVPIPEPTTAILLGLGLIELASLRVRRAGGSPTTPIL
jgi:hypothetical protein